MWGLQYREYIVSEFHDVRVPPCHHRLLHVILFSRQIICHLTIFWTFFFFFTIQNKSTRLFSTRVSTRYSNNEPIEIDSRIAWRIFIFIVIIRWTLNHRVAIVSEARIALLYIRIQYAASPNYTILPAVWVLRVTSLTIVRHYYIHTTASHMWAHLAVVSRSFASAESLRRSPHKTLVAVCFNQQP